MRRTLRELLAELRLRPEDDEVARTERCLAALFDPECAPGACGGEREEAELEAERRRWAQPHHVAR